MFNLTVSEAHTFYVGQDGWLVHNCGEVTEDVIRQVMKGAPLLSQQKAGVSLPKVQALVDGVRNGTIKWDDLKAIKVADGVIVDGNHTYIASRILGLEPRIQPSTRALSPKPVVPWESMPIDPKNWGAMITIYSDAKDPITLDVKTLEAVDLSGFDLHRAILNGQSLIRANFVEADLRFAEFEDANLISCDLSRATLVGAEMSRANLESACFRGSKCIAVVFSEANLTNADMTDADVDRANFRGAKMFGATMNCLDLDKSELTDALYDSQTVWPTGFNPEQYGALKIS